MPLDAADINHEKNQQLLKDLENCVGKVKREKKTTIKTEGDVKVCEFYKKQNLKLTISDLTAGLDRSDLKSYKTLIKNEENLKAIEKPLSEQALKTKKRKVLYRGLKKEMNDWQDSIISIKKAPIMKFPLDDQFESQPSLLDWIENDDTDKKEKVGNNANFHMAEEETLIDLIQKLPEKDRDTLSKFHLEEMLLKRQQLSKYYEFLAKFGKERNRVKKIKSKNYHRLQRKREKKEISKIDVNSLKVTNPEVYDRELEKADVMRAEERASLRHRGGSKWSKNKLLKGQINPQVRNALIEQFHINKELTCNKVIEEQDSDDENAQPDIKVDPFVDNKISKLLTNDWFGESPDQLQTLGLAKYVTLKPIINSKDKKLNVETLSDPKKCIETFIQPDEATKADNYLAEENLQPTLLINEPDQLFLDDIAEAFKDDDALNEFIDEKQKAQQEEDDTGSSVELPGWGNWATLENIEKVQNPPKAVNLSDGSPHVIFNPQKQAHLQKHLVTSIPTGIKDEDEFRESVSQPIGKDWNTQSSYIKSIRPFIQTKSGVPIHPLDSSIKADPETRKLRGLVECLPQKVREKINKALV